MTVDEIISAIEALLPNVTCGPWVAVDNSHAQLDKSRFENGAYMIVAPDDCEHHAVADFSCNHSCRDDDTCLANAEYVAAVSPENIAALIAAYREAKQ